MKYQFSHLNFNVFDLEKSLKFYSEVLHLVEKRRKNGPNFTIVFLGDEVGSSHQLELTYMHDRQDKYDIGEAEFHLAFEVDNYVESLKMHSDMGIVVFINEKMGIYFIEDLDGYWIEVLPKR